MGSSGKNPPEKVSGRDETDKKWQQFCKLEAVGVALKTAGLVEECTRCRAPAFCPSHPQADSSASPAWRG